MFQNVLHVEINAFALAGDVTALKHAIDRTESNASNWPGWMPTLLVAQARFQVLCSDFAAALVNVEEALSLLETNEGPRYPLGAIRSSDQRRGDAGRCERRAEPQTPAATVEMPLPSIRLLASEYDCATMRR